MYKSTPAFLTKEYDIDIANNKINVDSYKNIQEFLFEFLGDLVTVKTIPFTVLTWGIVMPFLLLFQVSISHLKSVFILISGFYLIVFLIFNTFFVTMPNKILRKLQMIFEVPVHIILYPHLRKLKSEIITLDKVDSVIYHFNWYWKYDMAISGKAGKYLKGISYKKINRVRGRLLTVEFSQPVTGSIVLKYRGTLLDTTVLYKT